MNKVFLMGRLTSNPDYRQNQTGTFARYTLAVDRFKDGTDYIRCVAFNKAADFADKYLMQGTKVLVSGRIQTGSYEKNGQKIYTTDVIIETQEFAEKKEEFVSADETPFM